MQLCVYRRALRWRICCRVRRAIELVIHANFVAVRAFAGSINSAAGSGKPKRRGFLKSLFCCFSRRQKTSSFTEAPPSPKVKTWRTGVGVVDKEFPLFTSMLGLTSLRLRSKTYLPRQRRWVSVRSFITAKARNLLQGGRGRSGNCRLLNLLARVCLRDLYAVATPRFQKNELWPYSVMRSCNCVWTPGESWLPHLIGCYIG
jgi:hypothetical protein